MTDRRDRLVLDRRNAFSDGIGTPPLIYERCTRSRTTFCIEHLDIVRLNENLLCSSDTYCIRVLYIVYSDCVQHTRLKFITRKRLFRINHLN